MNLLLVIKKSILNVKNLTTRLNHPKHAFTYSTEAYIMAMA